MSISQLSKPLCFNSHGENLFLERDNQVVARRYGLDDDTSGYVFINRPMLIGEMLHVRIHVISEKSKSIPGFGMTSCNPQSLGVVKLPDDCDLLHDRPEYWVIDKARLSDMSPGDELFFYFTEGANGDGEVIYSKNDLKPVSLMFLDKTIPLWAFFELGNIQEMKIIDSFGGFHSPPPPRVKSLPLMKDNIAPPQSRPSSLPNTAPARANTQPTRGRKPPPPPPPRPSVKAPAPTQPSNLVPTPLVALAKTTKNNEPANNKTSQKETAPARPKPPGNRIPGPQTNGDKTPENQNKNQPPGKSTQNGTLRKMSSIENECLVCMEKDVDCVIYTCGHMCLCFQCATDLKSRTNSSCPVCRQPITDVIKTFRS